MEAARPPGGPRLERALRIGTPVLVSLLALAALISMHEPRFAGVLADELVIASWAKQVAHGRAPYRDFFVFLGPATPYGLGALAWLAGPGTVPLRIASIVLQLAATLAIYSVARIHTVPRALSAGIALWYPLILVAFWPCASHQWLAGAFGVLAIASLFHARPHGRFAFLFGGVFAGIAGLMVQTIAAITIPAAVICAARRGRRTRPIAWLVAGLLVPATFAVALLVTQRAFRSAIVHVFVWPLRFYKQADGFNAGSILDSLSAHLQSLLTPVYPFADHLAVTFLLLLPVLTASCAVTALLIALRRKDRASPEWLAILALATTVATFLAGRNDVPHLAFLSPVFLLVLAAGFASRAGPVARVTRAFLVVGLVVAGIRWPILWAESPPSIQRVLNADAVTQRYVMDTYVNPLPGVASTRTPVAMLGAYSSMLYLYWSPAFPPVDWLVPPNEGSNSPDHYVRTAEFIRKWNMPFVLVGERELEDFLTEPSPIRELLAQDYRPLRPVRGAMVFERIAR